jgi:hypothetical protein
MYPREGDSIEYKAPTRLEMAKRGAEIATRNLDQARRVYAKACLEMESAIRQDRPEDRPKACTCCPTCGGTKG